MYRNLIIILGVILLIVSSCSNQPQAEVASVDPLPSWNEGETKSSIISYVEDITDMKSENFVPIPDRIAVFDNDGNLWSEKPLYFQMLFAIERVKLLALEHPEWLDQQPFKAVLENDMQELMKHGEHGILQLVMASHAGITTTEFEAIVKDWLATAKHPKFGRPYTELVFQPMIELINYLKANDFKPFIVSGGGIEFMRPWVEEIYGIPRDQVVGSSIKTKYDYNNGDPIIQRLPELDFIDDKEGKPEGIHKFIGRKPIFASGNSDGDLQMMRWTASNQYKCFMLYVHHTDSIREWSYDRTSSVGRLDKGLDEANEKGWTVIDMAKDWKVVYSFEPNSN